MCPRAAILFSCESGTLGFPGMKSGIGGVDESKLVRAARAARGHRIRRPGGCLFASGRSQGSAPDRGAVFRTNGRVRRSAPVRAFRNRVSRAGYGTLGGPEELGIRLCPRFAGGTALQLSAQVRCGVARRQQTRGQSGIRIQHRRPGHRPDDAVRGQCHRRRADLSARPGCAGDRAIDRRERVLRYRRYDGARPGARHRR